MITGMQIRAARALLGWDQTRLAQAAGVSAITVKRLEGAGAGDLPGRHETVMKIKRAAEKAGIEFVSGDGRLGVVHLQRRRR